VLAYLVELLDELRVAGDLLEHGRVAVELQPAKRLAELVDELGGRHVAKGTEHTSVSGAMPFAGAAITVLAGFP